MEQLIYEEVNSNVDLNSSNEEEVNSIEPNQTAIATRLALENKYLLEKAGSLYVGTGYAQHLAIPYETDAVAEIDVPITAALNPPELNGDYILLCRVIEGKPTLEWKKLSDLIPNN